MSSPSAPGYWFGRIADRPGSTWGWWEVRDEMEEFEGRPAWAWSVSTQHSRSGWRLGFIEWDVSVTPIPVAGMTAGALPRSCPTCKHVAPEARVFCSCTCLRSEGMTAGEDG